MLKHQRFVNCVFFGFCGSVVRFVLKCVEMVWNGRFLPCLLCMKIGALYIKKGKNI